MKTKIIKLIASVTAVLFLFMLATPAFADGKCEDICNCPGVSAEIKASAGCSNSPDKLSNTIQVILNSIIGVLGLVAVVFIIIGGVQYITSQGDSTKTKKAKDTILYACIGLVICALAFAIANFAIGIVNKS